MNLETVTHLFEINRRFYERYAEAFSASRQRPWQGWDRVLRHLPPGPLSILDLGCGNGRFSSFLANRGVAGFRYVGLDNNPSLLDHARARLTGLGEAATSRLEAFEIALQRPQEVLLGESFQLIALFGVLHHVPGADRRRQLLADCASLLETGGILAITIWRRDLSPGFAGRTVSWTGYNQSIARRPVRSGGDASPTIDLEELETGDYLLTWSSDPCTPRFCHFPEESEICRWLQGSGLRVVERFDADGSSGRENHYLLLTP